MSRFPPIPPSELTADQKLLYDEFNSFVDSTFNNIFVAKREDGALVGPFAAMFDTPEISRLYVNLVAAVGKVPDLPKQPREVAILAVGAKYQAAYEIYSHERVAATVGLSKSQIEVLKSGKKPEDLDENCSVAFDVAMELVNKPGPLSDSNWKRAVQQFGRRGAYVLANYVGLYQFICCLLNACDIPVPDGERIL